jgi:nitroreductase
MSSSDRPGPRTDDPSLAAIDEILTTTRTVRRGMDLTRPVARELIDECLGIALHAPNASNRQQWRFVLLDDPRLKDAVATYYRRAAAARAESLRAESLRAESLRAESLRAESLRAESLRDGAPMDAARHRIESSVSYLAQHLHEVPCLVLAGMRGRPPAGAALAQQASYWGSIFPALWSFMLAARSRGLVSALTTVHLAYEREVAEAIGIPRDEIAQAALIPVAHALRPRSRPAARRPVSEVAGWNSLPTGTSR